MSKKKIALFVGIGLLLFSAGFGTSTLLGRTTNAESKKFDLLARRVQMDNPVDSRVNFSDLRVELERMAKETNSDDNNSDKISIYFEYLPTGASIHINQENESIAASLMKVPFVMTLYEVANQRGIDLDKKIPLKKEWLNDEYGTLYQKSEGYELSLREAAELTLRDSDNTALLMIFDHLEDRATDKKSVIDYLDLEYDVTSDDRIKIGAQSYSSILKCLYFACYNTNEDAQEILSYLTESTFRDRLVKKLPQDLRVAHKIGTFSQEVQSDCGIFYIPNSNYVLCVMVHGTDPEASEMIANISEKVYKFVTAQHPEK